MTKRLAAVYLILIILLAVMIPSCGGGSIGTINVTATLCGSPWTGNVSYALTGPSTVNGNNVSASFSVATGTWTCAYVSGGPGGAFLNGTKPSATQSLSANGVISFTLDFELNQDAAIQFITWTYDGFPFQWSQFEAMPGQVMDVHFLQQIDGCPDRVVGVNKTSWLRITQTAGGRAVVYVINYSLALSMTPDPPAKLSLVHSFNGTPVSVGNSSPLTLGVPLDLDVETAWQLAQCVNYTESINWFGISAMAPPGFFPELFELSLEDYGIYEFTLVPSARIELADGEDANPGNDNATGPTLTLRVNVEP